jgi:hypothetical protein
MLKYLIAYIVLGSLAVKAQQPMSPSDMGTAPVTTSAGSSNTLQYGATVSTTFDDNTLLPETPARTETNLTSSFQPEVRMDIDRARWKSSLYYGPSFTYSNKIDIYNSSSQIVGADVQYSFTKRLSLHARNAFALSSNPLESFKANMALPNLGILNGSNPSALGANVRTLTEQLQADLVYMVDPHTSVGVGGTFAILNYDSVVSGVALTGNSVGSRVWSGNAFYSHQFTRRYSVGVQYSAQATSSDISVGQFASLTHAPLGFVNISLKPAVHVSVFAGPQRVELNDNLLAATAPFSSHLTKLTYAAGSSLQWQGEHNGLTASFVQRLGDAGLSGGGAVSMRSATLQIQHRITRQSSLSLSGNYISNSQFDPLSMVQLADAVSAGLTITKALTPRLTLSLSGLRQQFIGGSPVGFPQPNHDIAAVSLSYSFSQPIGR